MSATPPIETPRETQRRLQDEMQRIKTPCAPAARDRLRRSDPPRGEMDCSRYTHDSHACVLESYHQDADGTVTKHYVKNSQDGRREDTWLRANETESDRSSVCSDGDRVTAVYAHREQNSLPDEEPDRGLPHDMTPCPPTPCPPREKMAADRRAFYDYFKAHPTDGDAASWQASMKHLAQDGNGYAAERLSAHQRQSIRFEENKAADAQRAALDAANTEVNVRMWAAGSMMSAFNVFACGALTPSCTSPALAYQTCAYRAPLAVALQTSNLPPLAALLPP